MPSIPLELELPTGFEVNDVGKILISTDDHRGMVVIESQGWGNDPLGNSARKGFVACETFRGRERLLLIDIPQVFVCPFRVVRPYNTTSSPKTI